MVYIGLQWIMVVNGGEWMVNGWLMDCYYNMIYLVGG
jgi:hypothetical protein